MRPGGRLLLQLLMALALTACSSGPPPAESGSPTPTLEPTATPDTLAPMLVARAPGPDDVMATHGSIVVTFSEPISGVDESDFQLRDSAGSVLAANVTYDVARRLATLTPASPLTVGATYSVVLEGAIRDRAGNALAALSWTIAASDRVSFAAGTYTGYRFSKTFGSFDAIRRLTLAAVSGAPAAKYQLIEGQDFLLLGGGGLAGYWVHGTPDGVASRDLAAPVTPLPACVYLDLPTARSSFGAWATTVLDTLYALPSSYQPPDLVDTSRAGLNGGHLVRSLAIADLAALVAAAKADGARLAVESSYRSYGSQVATFNGWVQKVGYRAALRVSARPGHSEHELGTAIDFRSVSGPSPWDIPDWAVTTEGAWMTANSWRFGWVLSYPRGASAVSCYSYEPWHFRYVGRAIARAIHDSGATEREWLWAQGFGVR
ncbi:MAG: D-alanyl-D-alanine carboxypeptidase family protein [Chloroflexota bacterium]|nr:D-alanyl-D-alanine carboxypeptidase family protein [Chloroflexota bacterium]